jgi:hypothetical protein
MKKTFFKLVLWRLCFFALLPIIVSAGALCQSLTDAQLIKMGKSAYDHWDYPQASVYLFAYIQRNPPSMANNVEFAKQVQDAYQHSIDAVNQGLKERDQLRTQLAQARSESGVGMTTAGITIPPPPLNIPPEAGNPKRIPKGAFVGAMVANPVGGAWKYRMISNVAHDSHEGFMKLSLAGSSVTGSMSTWDKSQESVRGTLSGGTVELERDTGVGTIQHYKLAIEGDRMNGEFWNTGQYPDSGSIEMVRVR